MNALERRLLVLLRIPEKPQPPPGHATSLRVFRAAPAYWRYSLLRWSLGQMGALAGLVLSLTTLGFFDDIGFDDPLGALSVELPLLSWIGRIEVLAIGIFLAQAGIGIVGLWLGYRLRWYMVSDRSLRVREGVFRIREQTMTAANIQNMAVHRGPLQRAFGIADLEVRTAGGSSGSRDSGDASSSGSDHHLARLRGLANAEEVRELLWRALRRHRDSGLGDPDEARDLPATGVRAVGAEKARSEAARALLEEARALRRALEAG